ncbi:MAG TPA: carboxypeptidase regulatory-like domain-containing protein, partial [Pyrinomonadaceae bacterium]|nr:carboxypeptidase regulatory-like domain-containing protein [Pyrinomonadaceae bacterium]
MRGQSLFRYLFASSLVALLAWCAFAPAASSAQGPENVFNLADFGAVGDGSTDDGPALQRALDAAAAAGGGTINVPAGRFAIRTPVAKDFGGTGSIVIQGVESTTPVPPPTAFGDKLSLPLDLVSEFHPQTGAGAVALHIAGLESFLVKDIAFVGTPNVQTDAYITLNLHEINEASILHCEFYGLISQIRGGSIVRAARSHLTLAQSKFLGSTGNSGVNVPTVECLEWKGITVENTIFIDYGQRPELFSKTGMAAAYSWLIIGNAAQPTADSPRREVVLREVFFDEGALNGLSALPSLYPPSSAPIDLLYITGLYQNVANLGTSGHYLTDLRGLLVEKSHYGWSQRADVAINMLNIGNAILDEIECVEDAERLRADNRTGRLTVINSIYAHLDSLAQFTDIRQTATPQEDPVQYVRQQFETIAGREPDGAAHYFWSDKLLRCGADASCLNAGRAALNTYLNNAPTPTFTLAGQVLDEDGDALPGVAVALTGSQAASTVTDAEGRYRFSRLPTSGIYTVTPTRRHYNTFGPASRTFTTPAGDLEADFLGIVNRHDLRGRVTVAGGAGLSGVAVSLSGSQAGSTTTDASGNYSFLDLPAGGNYTVTPSLLSHTFAPAAQTSNDLDADRTLNFTGTLVTFSISGRVTAAGGVGLAGATLSLTGHRTATATSDANGNYTFPALPKQGNYTVTVSRANYTFAQASKSFNDLNANQIANFNGTLVNYTLAGRVTSGGAGLSGVVVALSGAQTAQRTTDANGNYSFTLPAEGDYTLTPSKANYTFTPPTRVFNKLAANQTTADFAATLNRHTISGRVVNVNNTGVPGVLLTLSGAQTGTTTTGADGSYSFANLAAEGNYTVTPSLRHHNFTPPSKTFNALASNQQASFSVTLNSHKISGRVTAAGGAGLAGATLSLSGSHSASTTSDSNGNYTFAGLPAGGNYAVSVSKELYTFSTGVQTFGDLDADKTANFSGTLVNLNLGGRVTAA